MQDVEHYEITSSLSYPAWSECMKSCAVRNQGGLYAWKDKEDRDGVAVLTYYKVAATDTKQKVPLQVTVKRGDAQQVSLEPRGTMINNEETVPLIVDRREKTQSQNAPVLPTFKAGQYAVALDSVWKDPPQPPNIKKITTSEVAPCSGQRVGAPDDGFPPIFGDKHRFSLHCTAPGKVTKVDVIGYDDYGGCRWITRFPDDPNDAIGSPTPNEAWLRFWTDSSDQCIVRMSVHYESTITTCDGADCPGKIPLPSVVLGMNYTTILEQLQPSTFSFVSPSSPESKTAKILSKFERFEVKGARSEGDGCVDPANTDVKKPVGSKYCLNPTGAQDDGDLYECRDDGAWWKMYQKCTD